MYTLLGISLSLAFLLIVNLTVAVAANSVWRLVSRHTESLASETRSRIIFSLRVLPLAAALIFVLVYIVPAYLLHEPNSSGETVTPKLALIAGASVLGIALAAYRVFETWWVTRRLIANWMQNAVGVSLGPDNVQILRIRHRFPVIAVVGIFRPRIFIAESILDSLTPEELETAIAHEYGHLSSRDNLKRTILRFCSDLLVLPFGKRLDSEWSENTEAAADDFAVRRGDAAALDLASALVKIARIATPDARPSMPAGAFLVDCRSGDVTSRVRRLLSFSDRSVGAVKGRWFGVSPIGIIWSAAILALMVLPLADQKALASTHDAIEKFVRFLQ